jgi:membrane-bound lytic murein transglycosylase D
MLKGALFIFISFYCTSFAMAQEQRIGFQSLFTVVEKKTTEGNALEYQLHPKAISFIQTYMDKEGPALKKMKTWARPYFNLYDQILIANGVPVELKYLSVIESNLNNNVVSWAGAVGPWQIMPDEATRLGLKLQPMDERTDYEKSTKAAATILKELYTEFGDWLLVVAAYNGGLGRVRQVIQKKKTKDFWQLQYDLPLETRNHVKKFIATQYVFETDRNWEDLFVKSSPMPLDTSKRIVLDSLSITGRFVGSVIAKELDMSLKDFRQWNPGFDNLIATGKPYLIKLPPVMMEKMKARKNEILQASIIKLSTIPKN